jgi:serine phosphatase RsbU (regulator of sigma subunit)
MPLWARFTLTMSLALSVTLAAMGYFVYQTAHNIVDSLQERALVQAADLSADSFQLEVRRAKLEGEHQVFAEYEKLLNVDLGKVRSEPGREAVAREALIIYQEQLRDRVKAAREAREKNYSELAQKPYWFPTDKLATSFPDVTVKRFAMEYGPEKIAGLAYQVPAKVDGGVPFALLFPKPPEGTPKDLIGVIIGATLLVVVIGALVSVWAAHQVTEPLVQLVQDVRKISTGDLTHHVHSRGSAETAALGRALDTMVKSLAEARHNSVELEVREREVAVASEVREQLLPQNLPRIAGYELGHAHIASGVLGGDFHDVVEIGPNARDGVGLLVGEISGKGLPGALVGATARSYLRAKLSDGGDLKTALQQANQQLARDVRRGMAVTSLYAQVDPTQGIALVACTGHKIALIRYTAADKKVRLIHPEGIALGFDKGPVFDGKLEIAKVPIEPGDRLVLVNTAAVAVTDGEGRELGEKALYGLVMRLGGLPTASFVEKLRAALLEHAGETALPRDISMVTISRS